MDATEKFFAAVVTLGFLGLLVLIPTLMLS
jgi:hypothetical protein